MLWYNVVDYENIVNSGIKFDNTAQNRLIIAGLFISTILIIAVSIFAIGKIQEKIIRKLCKLWAAFRKTIAIQSYELTKNKSENEKLKY